MSDQMPPWRDKAIQMLPELEESLRNEESSYIRWTDIRQAFDEAYRAQPRNESLISRIYRLAHWCECQPRGATADDDLSTCVAVCFYEHIPECAEAREDMPRWFKLSDIDHPRSIFRYRLEDSEWNSLVDHLRRNAKKFVPGLRTGEDPRSRKKKKKK